MIITALWVLEKEIEFVRKQTSGWPPIMEHPYSYLGLGIAATAQSAFIAQMPYHLIYAAQARTDWAVADIAYSSRVASKSGMTAAKYETMTFWNYAPKTRAFAARGGARFVATKLASRALGPIGVALLMVDAWKTGVWIGEKLFGELE